jgi:hypothetical protein
MSLQDHIIEGLLMFPMSTISSIVAIQKIKSTHADIQLILDDMRDRGYIELVGKDGMELYRATKDSNLYDDIELKRQKYTRLLKKIKDFEELMVEKIREIKNDQDFTNQSIKISDFITRYNLTIGVRDQVIAILHRTKYIDINIIHGTIHLFKS